MTSMVFASSPFGAQSFVKLRTNSIYSHPSCCVPRVKNSYVHFSYKNISHIESSKALFIKGDDNFSFSSPKFPRVASTYSPSLNIIKACSKTENIYRFPAFEGFDRYRGMVLLIVNIPQTGSKCAKEEIEFLNDLRKLYEGKISKFGGGFEVLGFFYDMKNKKSRAGREKENPEIEAEKENPENEAEKENPEIEAEKERIRKLANFPIFEKVDVNDNHHDNLFKFLRKSNDNEPIKEEFEKFLVNRYGEPVKHFPRFDGETVEPKPTESGGNPGVGSGSKMITSPIEAAIDDLLEIKN